MKPHYTNTNNPIDFPKSDNKMNERIHVLAEEAGLNCDGTPDARDQEAIERFAELIVKETIDHMTAQMFYYSINGSKNLSFSQAIDKTKEHFGVKE